MLFSKMRRREENAVGRYEASGRSAVRSLPRSLWYFEAKGLFTHCLASALRSPELRLRTEEVVRRHLFVRVDAALI